MEPGKARTGGLGYNGGMDQPPPLRPIPPPKPTPGKPGITPSPLPGRPRPAPIPLVEVKPGPMDYFRAIFLQVPDRVDWVSWGGRALVLAVLIIWGLTFMFHSVSSNYVGQSFLHNVNLPFHEAGHIIFSLFGRFMQVAGGTLGQLLMPLIVMFAFLWKNRDAFGASVGLWWLGESLMDTAPYINDARDLNLVLLGGVTGKDVDDYHDWQYLLGELRLLPADHALAQGAHWLGIGLMVTAFVWGGYMLYRQYQIAKD
jgi:hypothetical protein